MSSLPIFDIIEAEQIKKVEVVFPGGFRGIIEERFRDYIISELTSMLAKLHERYPERTFAGCPSNLICINTLVPIRTEIWSDGKAFLSFDQYKAIHQPQPICVDGKIIEDSERGLALLEEFREKISHFVPKMLLGFIIGKKIINPDNGKSAEWICCDELSNEKSLYEYFWRMMLDGKNNIIKEFHSFKEVLATIA